MPSGAKKRKALKKKKQQEAIGTSTNDGDNLHGHDEHGSQDEKESDSNLSSPGSQRNEQFDTKDTSAAISSGMVKGTTKEISGDVDVSQGLDPQSGNAIAVEKGTDDKNNVENSLNSSSGNCTLTTKNVACQDACGNSVTEIAPVFDSVKPVGSVSKVVLSEKSEHVETSTHLQLAKHMSDVNEEYPSPGLEKDHSKVVTFSRPAAETSNNVEGVKDYEVPVSSEGKRLLLSGPPAVRTSWLSCCGLFDAMTGSDR